VAESASGILEQERTRLERAGRVVSLGAMDMTRRLELRLERLSGETARLSGERLLGERHRLSNLAARASERPAMFLTRAGERLVGFERAVALRRPENILALGFAIVRSGGRAVLDPAALEAGQPLDITLAKGAVKAKVTKTT
jgi:exodeoxyribonuclease VII large subunit